VKKCHSLEDEWKILSHLVKKERVAPNTENLAIWLKCLLVDVSRRIRCGDMAQMYSSVGHTEDTDPEVLEEEDE